MEGSCEISMLHIYGGYKFSDFLLTVFSFDLVLNFRYMQLAVDIFFILSFWFILLLQ